MTTLPTLTETMPIATNDRAAIITSPKVKFRRRRIVIDHPDPKAGDAKLVVVDLEPVRPLARPVTLAEVKADPAFADFALVRQGRLSVMPVPPALWKRLLGLAGAARG